MRVRSIKKYIITVKSKHVLNSVIAEVRKYGAPIHSVFHRHPFGFCASITDLSKKLIENDSRVINIEESFEVELCLVQENAPFHLDRIDQQNRPLSGSFRYTTEGEGIRAYVVDSGGMFRDSDSYGFQHEEFIDGQNYRVKPIKDFRPQIINPNTGMLEPNPDINKAFDPFHYGVDRIEGAVKPGGGFYHELPRGFDEFVLPDGYILEGHGTHVAGLIAGKTYGVAKKAEIVSVKAFSVFGKSSIDIIIDALNNILDDYEATGRYSSVCNFSWRLNGISTVLENKIQELYNNGITIFTAAGNDAIDASMITPARMPEVITVGSFSPSKNADYFSSFSNYGPVVDILAPGAQFYIKSNGKISEIGLISATQSSNTEVTNNSVSVKYGTSMSTPLATGVGILFIKEAEFLNTTLNPDDIKQQLIQNAVPLVLEDIPDTAYCNGPLRSFPTNTTNLGLYSTHVDYQVDWITPSGLIGAFNEGYSVNTVVVAEAYDAGIITYSLSPTSNSLPVGLSLNAMTGAITGIGPVVSQNTNYTFTIRAQAGAYYSDRIFNIDILDAALPPKWITYEDLGQVEEGISINISLYAISRNPDGDPITYSIIGTLPLGWNLSTSGVLTGITPTVINVFKKDITFTIQASDNLAYADRTFKISILQTYKTPPTWLTPSGKLGTVLKDEYKSFNLQTTDVDLLQRPVTYHLQYDTGDGSIFGPYGSLPGGMSLDEVTGIISGTFNGDFSGSKELNHTSFDDETTTFDETINFDLLNGVFEFQVFITDGAFVIGRLFSIEALYRTPNIPPQWITESTTIASIPALSFASIPIGAFDPDNYPNLISYSLIPGSTLPTGMTLNSTNGRISGVPLNVIKDKEFPFVVRASDGISYSDRTFSIKILRTNEAPQWKTAAGLIGSFSSGTYIRFKLEATDPNSDLLNYSIIDGLTIGTTFDNNSTTLDANSATFSELLAIGNDFIPGLTLDTTTGLIHGVVRNIIETTTYSFTARVDDSRSNDISNALFSDREFSIIITANPNENNGTNNPPIWITQQYDLPDGIEHVAYYYQLEAVDNDLVASGLSYIVIAGTLPQGLALNSRTGVISGFPTDEDSLINLFTFVVRVSDGALYADNTFSIKINEQVIINNPPVWITPSGNLGIYNESELFLKVFEATDLENDTITYHDASIFPNFIPSTLTLSSTGVLSGNLPIISSDTTYTFSLEARDSRGLSSFRTFQITVNNIPNIEPVWVTGGGLLGEFNEGTSVVIDLEAIDPDNGPQPLIYTITSGNLPPNLTLNTTNGIISGLLSPITIDTLYNFDVTASDGASFITRTFQIFVRNRPDISSERSRLSVAMTGPFKSEWLAWNNISLIDDEDLYKDGELEFGRNLIPNIYVINNLFTVNPTTVFNAFGEHHRDFDVLIGLMDYAVVRNKITGVVEYEVIYLPIIDPQKNSNFNIANTIIPSLYNTNGIEKYVSYNFDHLRQELESIPNDDTLPEWMTSEQILGDSTSIIGYIPAIPVATVKPGVASSIVKNLNQVKRIEVTLPNNETTFDFDKVYGEKIEPVINHLTEMLFEDENSIIESLVLDGTIIPLNVYDIAGLINSNINLQNAGIYAIVAENEIFNILTSTFSVGDVLVINYSSSILKLTNVQGFPLDILGLPTLVQQTIFDNDTSTFDAIPGTEVRIERGLGLQFTGRKQNVDRYLFENNAIGTIPGTTFGNESFDYTIWNNITQYYNAISTIWDDMNAVVVAQSTTFDSELTTFDTLQNTSKWLKFISDYSPVWITNPGFIGNFSDTQTVNIQLEYDSPYGLSVTYRKIRGSFPPGAEWVDLSNGVSITGTIGGIIPVGSPNDVYHFTIRIEDTKGNYRDRSFFMTVNAPTIFDNDTCTFDIDACTFDAT